MEKIVKRKLRMLICKLVHEFQGIKGGNGIFTVFFRQTCNLGIYLYKWVKLISYRSSSASNFRSVSIL